MTPQHTAERRERVLRTEPGAWGVSRREGMPARQDMQVLSGGNPEASWHIRFYEDSSRPSFLLIQEVLATAKGKPFAQVLGGALTLEDAVGVASELRRGFATLRASRAGPAPEGLFKGGQMFLEEVPRWLAAQNLSSTPLDFLLKALDRDLLEAANAASSPAFEEADR